MSYINKYDRAVPPRDLVLFFFGWLLPSSPLLLSLVLGIPLHPVSLMSWQVWSAMAWHFFFLFYFLSAGCCDFSLLGKAVALMRITPFTAPLCLFHCVLPLSHWRLGDYTDICKNRQEYFYCAMLCWKGTPKYFLTCRALPSTIFIWKKPCYSLNHSCLLAT